MNLRGVQEFAQPGRTEGCRVEYDGVVEIPLLLPHWQAEAVECVAHEQGLTTGELIRHLLLDYLSKHASGR